MAPRNSTTIPDTPSRDAINQGVLEAFIAAGFATDGAKDKAKLRTRVVEIVSEAVVTTDTKKDREDHAIKLSDLIRQLFPNLPVPPVFTGAEDEALAEAVYKRIKQDLWNQLQTGARGAVQRAMLNGDVLGRTRVGPDVVPAVYVSSTFKVLKADNIDKATSTLKRLFDKEVEDRLDMINRLDPKDAKAIMRSWLAPLKVIESDAHQRLALAVEQRVANGEINAPEPAVPATEPGPDES